MKNKIYILDKKQKTIFIYDKSGKYLNKLSKIGRGPGEYILIDFFDVNDKEEIIIADMRSNNIIHYNQSTTNALHQFKVNSHIINMAVLTDSTYCILSNSDENKLDQKLLSVYDREGNLLEEDMVWSKEYVEAISGTDDFTPMYRDSNGDLCFKKMFSNKVFVKTTDTLYCKSDFILEGRLSIEEAIFENSKKFKNIFADDGGVGYFPVINSLSVFGAPFIDNKDYILCSVIYKTKIFEPIYLFYDKINNSVVAYEVNKTSKHKEFYEFLLNSDRDYTLSDAVRLHTAGDNTIISKLYPEFIIDALSKELPTDATENIKIAAAKLKQLNLNKNSNPVLLFFKP